MPATTPPTLDTATENPDSVVGPDTQHESQAEDAPESPRKAPPSLSRGAMKAKSTVEGYDTVLEYVKIFD